MCRSWTPPSVNVACTVTGAPVPADAGPVGAATTGTALVTVAVTVADVVRVPVGTVKSRLHYATRILRSALTESGPVDLSEEVPA